MAYFKGFENQAINIQIQTSSACTGKCIMCPYLESWHKQNPGVMSDEVFDKIINQLSAFKINKFCPYLENEPFADPKIFDRLRKIRAAFPNAVLSISTNALALNKENSKKLADILAGTPHDLWFSFHGSDKTSYEGIMGIPFEKCYGNIVNFLSEYDDLGLTIEMRGAGFGRVKEINHNYCFDNDDYMNLWNSTFDRLKLKNRPKVRFYSYHDRAGSIKRNNININRVIRPSLKDFRCMRLSNWLHFLYTGELILCCMDYHRETVFGNIATHDLREILNNKDFVKLGDQLTGKEESADNFICKRCISPGG